MKISLKVLLVEDNENDGALVIRQPERANYDVKFRRVEHEKQAGDAEILMKDKPHVIAGHVNDITGRTRKPTVLLVEDNEDNVFVTSEFCKNYYTIDTVANGVEAVQKAGERTYDIILMDINLGLGMNGLEAAAMIKKSGINRNTPIIAMTGLTCKEDRERILSNGCDYYLGKPFNKKDILTLLGNVTH